MEKVRDKFILAIDFDGTCVTHEYPDTGKDIGATEILRRLLDKGHELILYTMRSGRGLQEAIDWFKVNDLRLYGIQYNPTQSEWSCSNKCYAHIYIDDAALGCPLTYPKNGKRPYVNWKEVEKLLIKRGLL